jgi:hypothetical protein
MGERFGRQGRENEIGLLDFWIRLLGLGGFGRICLSYCVCCEVIKKHAGRMAKGENVQCRSSSATSFQIPFSSVRGFLCATKFQYSIVSIF